MQRIKLKPFLVMLVFYLCEYLFSKWVSFPKRHPTICDSVLWLCKLILPAKIKIAVNKIMNRWRWAYSQNKQACSSLWNEMVKNFAITKYLSMGVCLEKEYLLECLYCNFNLPPDPKFLFLGLTDPSIDHRMKIWQSAINM